MDNGQLTMVDAPRAARFFHQWTMGNGQRKRRGRDVLNAQFRLRSLINWGLTMRNIIFSSMAGLMAMCFLACGGGGSKPEPATSLSYTDPPASGYRLAKGAASSGGLLVLELRGPSGIMGRGVTFAVEADTSKATFVKVDQADTEMVQNNTFHLGEAPQLFKAVVDGNALRVSIAQQGPGNAQSLDGVLARVALRLAPGAAKGAVTLQVKDAKILPAEGTSQNITIACGAISAQ
jgi:hypothetical protein